MRRGLIALGFALLALALLPVAGGARAPQKGSVEGTVLDTTCAAGCEAECPPVPVTRGAAGRIVCPLAQGRAPRVCTQAGCPGPPIVRFPRYEGTDATVILRRAGSAAVLRKVPVSAGEFDLRLAPGRYVLRPTSPSPAGPGPSRWSKSTRAKRCRWC